MYRHILKYNKLLNYSTLKNKLKSYQKNRTKTYKKLCIITITKILSQNPNYYTLTFGDFKSPSPT